MKSILTLLLLLVLFACAPIAPAPESPPPIVPVQVNTVEQVITPAKNFTDTPPQNKTQESPERIIEPYTDLNCDTIISSEQAIKACDQISTELVVTTKIGTKNCFINIRNKDTEGLTAGITLTAFKNPDTARAEFQRRLSVLSLGADRSVGERAYTLPKIDRDTLSFVRNNYIVDLGSDVRLCTKTGVIALAKIVDSRLK